MATPMYNQTIDEDVEVSNMTSTSLIAATAFLVYAYVLTLGREVNYIWVEPRRPASWIYALIRYPTLVSQVVSICLTATTPNCNAVANLTNWSQFIGLVTSYAFQILRTYAVCGNSIVLAGILLVTILPSVVLAIILNLDSLCTPTGNFTETEYTIQLASDTLFETMVFVATVWAAWSQAKSSRKSSITGHSISSSLLHNGALYFGIFLAIEIRILVTSNVPDSVLDENIGNPPAVFTLPIRTTLSCQFLLELRERSTKTSTVTSTVDETTTMSTFQATVQFVNAAIDDDFGESPVHFVPSAGSGGDIMTGNRSGRHRDDIELRECIRQGSRGVIDAGARTRSEWEE